MHCSIIPRCGRSVLSDRLRWQSTFTREPEPMASAHNARIPRHEAGSFVKPTVLDAVPADSELADTEIFGPVLSLVHASDMDEALAFLERSAYGNQASLFTSSGSAARRFRYEAPAGNIGI